MLIVGLTGGIGSGKSVAAEFFAALGVPIIDSDIIAREVLEHDKVLLAKIVTYFGSTVLDAAGKLDRAKLRQHIFEQPPCKKWLEALLHPIIMRQIKQHIAQINRSIPYCIVVIPLLVEVEEAQSLVARVLLIDATEETQLMRTVQRDKVTMVEAEKVLALQATREQRLKIADDVILNEEDAEHLRQAVLKMHRFYEHLSKCD